ncbi:MAG TPA: hypothetical protein PLP42_07150 [Acidobacteriota bacterium]|nr:hypothetical protein [Acidobacteriota bacterium]
MTVQVAVSQVTAADPPPPVIRDIRAIRFIRGHEYPADRTDLADDADPDSAHYGFIDLPITA